MVYSAENVPSQQIFEKDWLELTTPHIDYSDGAWHHVNRSSIVAFVDPATIVNVISTPTKCYLDSFSKEYDYIYTIAVTNGSNLGLNGTSYSKFITEESMRVVCAYFGLPFTPTSK